MEYPPAFPFILPPPTFWIHCIACDCLTDGSAAFVNNDGEICCGICGTPIIMGWDDGD